MADLTQPSDVDVALRVLLTEPSYAAQVLTAAALRLEARPTDPVTVTAVDAALDLAADRILRNLPDAVCADSSTRASRVLPPLAGVTRGEYALRLRAAARDLG